MGQPKSTYGRREFLWGLPLSIAASAAVIQAQDKTPALDELQEQLQSEKRAIAAAAFADLEQRAKADPAAQKVLEGYLERRKEFFERCGITTREAFDVNFKRTRNADEIIFRGDREIPLVGMHLVYSLSPLVSLVALSQRFTDKHLSYFAGNPFKYLTLQDTSITGATLGELDVSRLRVVWLNGSPLAEEHLRRLEFPELGQFCLSDTPVTNQFLKDLRAPQVAVFYLSNTKIDSTGLKLLPEKLPELGSLHLGLNLATKENLTALFAENRKLQHVTVNCSVEDFDRVVELKPAAKGRLGISVPGLPYEELKEIMSRFKQAKPKSD